MVIIPKKIATVICVSFLFTACAKGLQSQQPIPEEGLTVSALYQKSFEAPIKKMPSRTIIERKPLSSFQSLPNPLIPLHVFSHVAFIGDEQIIKPAYTTEFFLYKKNQYALASELY